MLRTSARNLSLVFAFFTDFKVVVEHHEVFCGFVNVNLSHFTPEKRWFCLVKYVKIVLTQKKKIKTQELSYLRFNICFILKMWQNFIRYKTLTYYESLRYFFCFHWNISWSSLKNIIALVYLKNYSENSREALCSIEIYISFQNSCDMLESCMFV